MRIFMPKNISEIKIPHFSHKRLKIQVQSTCCSRDSIDALAIKLIVALQGVKKALQKSKRAFLEVLDEIRGTKCLNKDLKRSQIRLAEEGINLDGKGGRKFNFSIVL